LKHHATSEFWDCYRLLSLAKQALADKNFELLKQNPSHPSLHFKRVGSYYSARVSIDTRALGIAVEGGVVWFWIGTHAEYDKLVG
jgi:hypothetical protein